MLDPLGLFKSLSWLSYRRKEPLFRILVAPSSCPWALGFYISKLSKASLIQPQKNLNSTRFLSLLVLLGDPMTSNEAQGNVKI